MQRPRPVRGRWPVAVVISAALCHKPDLSPPG